MNEHLLKVWNLFPYSFRNAIIKPAYKWPRVLAEEFVTSVGNQLYDYKIFCFNGEPFCFYTAIDHFKSVVSKISFYDMDWNMLPVKYGDHENAKIDPPFHKQEMIETAKKLSKDFPFVRVDFFETEEKLYMAELTFYPGGGFYPYHSESLMKRWGSTLSCRPRNNNPNPRRMNNPSTISSAVGRRSADCTEHSCA